MTLKEILKLLKEYCQENDLTAEVIFHTGEKKKAVNYEKYFKRIIAICEKTMEITR